MGADLLVPTLMAGFPKELLQVADWAHSMRRNGVRIQKEGNWVWVKPAENDVFLTACLKPAQFKASKTRLGWWFHVGHRWRPGDVVRLPDGNSVLPYGPLTEFMKPGQKPKTGSTRNTMDKGRGIRARIKNDLGEIMLMVDWITRDWDFGVAQSEALVGRLEAFQATTFTLKAWRVPPPKPPDFKARVQRDLSDLDLYKLCLRRQNEAELVRKVDPVKQAHEKLADTVHDPRISLTEKARAELKALLQPGAIQPDMVLKTIRTLLTQPGLILPKDLPQSIEALEAVTGPTTTIQ